MTQELKIGKKPEVDNNKIKANKQKDNIISTQNEVTPMSQTKNDSKRETFFVNY